MVAPSPDWFVGVAGLLLIEDGQWVESKTILLKVYDAGTDSGRGFTSADIDTVPRGLIQKLTSMAEDTDFREGGPVVGTFTFRRQL